MWIAGPTLAIGYLNMPERTAERFIPDPFAAAAGKNERLYDTGDRCRYLPSGSIEVIGRCDFMVKVRPLSLRTRAVEKRKYSYIYQGALCICLLSQPAAPPPPLSTVLAVANAAAQPTATPFMTTPRPRSPRACDLFYATAVVPIFRFLRSPTVYRAIGVYEVRGYAVVTMQWVHRLERIRGSTLCRVNCSQSRFGDKPLQF